MRSRGFSAKSAQKIVDTVVRVSREPYDFRGTTRTPRLSSGSGAFFAQPASGIAAATGTWPTLTLSSTTADIYVVTGAAMVKVETAKTIYNTMPDATVAGHRLAVLPNPDGTWSAINHSCSVGT